MAPSPQQQQPTPEQLAQMPIAPPPPGVQSNFVNPPSRAPLGYGLISLALGLMLAVSFIRFYTRIFVVRSFGKDDWACVAAVLITTGYNIVGYLLFAYDTIGRHAWDIPMIKYMKFGDLFNANQPLYPIAFLAIKATLLLLIIRVFGPNKLARYLAYGGLAVMSLFYIITFILTLVWCAPAPGASSLLAVSGPNCQVLAHKVSNGQAAFNVIGDIYILTIPIPVILKLNRSNKRKLGIILVFALGLVATGLSIFTLHERVAYSGEPWRETVVEIATIYEMDVGVICACLPCIPAIMNNPRMKHLFSSIGYWSKLRSRQTPAGGRSAASSRTGEGQHQGHSTEGFNMHLLKDAGTNGGFQRVDSVAESGAKV